MLDLDASQIPDYKFKLNGKEHTFDPLELAFAAETLAGERNPRLVRKALEEVTQLKLTSLQSIQLLQDVMAFVEEHASETLKNVIGQSPSSTTTTESPQESIESSEPEISSDSSETSKPLENSEPEI